MQLMSFVLLECIIKMIFQFFVNLFIYLKWITHNFFYQHLSCFIRIIFRILLLIPNLWSVFHQKHVKIPSLISTISTLELILWTIYAYAQTTQIIEDWGRFNVQKKKFSIILCEPMPFYYLAQEPCVCVCMTKSIYINFVSFINVFAFYKLTHYKEKPSYYVVFFLRFIFPVTLFIDILIWERSY